MQPRRWQFSAMLWAVGLAGLLAFAPAAVRADEHHRGEGRERQGYRDGDRHERDHDRRDGRDDDRRDARGGDRHDRRDSDRDERYGDRNDGRECYDRNIDRGHREVVYRVDPWRYAPAPCPVFDRRIVARGGYYDPYCHESFASLSLYFSHALAHGHVAFIWRLGGDSPLPLYVEPGPVVVRCGN